MKIKFEFIINMNFNKQEFMSFKDRVSELSNNSGILEYAADGASLCYETLKTCKIITF